ncbi:AIR synthase family protein [Halomicroarcula sp. S1AR25-4]|uniref:AIR synthase family protein n=1 Tax=Haloarcula sp. S1AR25-4 TaxID=2950538 RepID=UPI0028749182|nr:AIR synthase family protein [Halomicroarcula sp. S1AR25-4]MDS0277838.1 AIR synthase family protein [Halomicroarcula sp. S1AR25-4]
MPELGKVDRDFFGEYIYPNLGADREDVTLGPQHGVDFGVVDVGEKAVAMATDPVFVMPSLGFERAAWFAFHILMSDVAVSGLPPTHLSVDFNLPPEITNEEFQTVWETFDAEARELGVSVVTGHTGRYAGCNYPMVGGATAISVGEFDQLVRPDGAQVGDRIVVTKGPAIEATGLLSIQFESLMDAEMDADDIADATDRFYDMSPVKDALTAAAAGPVNAMHDATECGIYGGLYEMARAADVGVELETEKVPIQPGVREACEFFGIDPWISISEGTLLAAVDPDGVDDVLDALDAEGIPAADAGVVTAGSGLVVDGEPTDHPGVDPFWGTFEEYMGKLQE